MTRLALFNSRKPRRVSPLDRWVRLTAELARRIARNGDTLVCGLGPLHYDLPLCCALDAGGRVDVVLEVPTGSVHAEALRVGYPDVFAAERVRFLEPAVERMSCEERDRAIAAAAEGLIVVEARTGGVVERLALDGLRRGRPVLACPPGRGTCGSANPRLLAAGAVELDPGAGHRSAEARGDCLQPAANGLDTARFACGLPVASPWPFVVHFTRTCPRELPGESRMEFVRALSTSVDPLFHRGIRILERMLVERRIRASGRLIRGGTPVVSFTAAHPAAVAELARWARHLGRWTFEPYGIGLRRDAACARGLRPVVYGPSGLYDALPATERALYQAAGAAGPDWSAEQEWRACGDVDLSGWPPEDAVVVVPDAATARRIRRLSPFPVVALAGRRRNPVDRRGVLAGRQTRW